MTIRTLSDANEYPTPDAERELTVVDAEMIRFPAKEVATLEGELSEGVHALQHHCYRRG